MDLNVVIQYRDCLGFKDFKNFDGVRFAYIGVRQVAFKLKKAIDVASLIKKQHFDYKRRVKINNKIVKQIIKCKIKGVRLEALKLHLDRKNRARSFMKMNQLLGYEYRIHI